MRLNLYFSILLSFRDFLVVNGDKVSDRGNGPGMESRWRPLSQFLPRHAACFVQVILTRTSRNTVSGFSFFVLEDNKSVNQPF